MIRLIKRYGSRKLYDTEESRYVSLDELAAWIRSGQEVRVVDNDSGDDVTTQTLAQVILEQGKRGATPISSEVFHELIRSSGQRLRAGAAQMQARARDGVDRIVQTSLERLAPVREARREMEALRERLGELENTLQQLEAETSRGTGAATIDQGPDAAHTAQATTRAASTEKRPSGVKKKVTKKKAAGKKAVRKKVTRASKKKAGGARASTAEKVTSRSKRASARTKKKRSRR